MCGAASASLAVDGKSKVQQLYSSKSPLWPCLAAFHIRGGRDSEREGRDVARDAPRYLVFKYDALKSAVAQPEDACARSRSRSSLELRDLESLYTTCTHVPLMRESPHSPRFDGTLSTISVRGLCVWSENEELTGALWHAGRVDGRDQAFRTY